MNKPQQLKLKFNDVDNGDTLREMGFYSGRELGTFKDSMRAPIFRWFRYPAGYSYKFVYESFDIFNVQKGNWVYDPFSGTGTTLMCAKQRNINGYGVEAHSFVHWVAETKLFWDFDLLTLTQQINDILKKVSCFVNEKALSTTVDTVFPELIYKCYHPHDLIELYLIREFVNEFNGSINIQNLLKLALTDTLRAAAVAQTGWPYIKPKKNPETYPPKNALQVFSSTLNSMLGDLHHFVGEGQGSVQINQLGDARVKQSLGDEQIDLALTSPPYLNNYDYADRTRLETYFWGITQSWSDITTQFRDKLMVAATTQVRRSEYDIETVLSEQLLDLDKPVYGKIQNSIEILSERRREKAGKKDYDFMIALYFNHMVQALSETYRVLKNGGYFVLVLGDSAPYGEYIPTDEYIGQLALGIGFSDYKYHQLRTRGGKWRDNPQRHSVPLREGIVILKK